MKALLCVLLLVTGCATIPLPPEPQMKEMVVYPVEGGVCIDSENMKILLDNVRKLKADDEKLRELIKEHNR